MKKKVITIIITTIMITTLLVGCDSGFVRKTMEQAQSEIIASEYDKALELINLVLEKDSDNEEALKLQSIINTYNVIVKSLNEKKYEEANKTLVTLNTEYKNYEIKKDIDKIKDEINEYYTVIGSIENYLIEAEEKFNNGSYEECRSLITSGVLESQDIKINKYIKNEHKDKAYEIVSKCDTKIAEIESKKITSNKVYNLDEIYLNGVPIREVMEMQAKSAEEIFKKAQENAKLYEEQQKQEGMNGY